MRKTIHTIYFKSNLSGIHILVRLQYMVSVYLENLIISQLIENVN